MANETLTSAVAGETEAARLTFPLNPPVGEADTVNVVLPPESTVADGGVAVIVKSPAAKAGRFTNKMAARAAERTQYLRKEATFARARFICYYGCSMLWGKAFFPRRREG